MAKSEDAFIIAVDKFIVATRDSGYKGTPEAIAELVDNAIQAAAREIHIEFDAESADDPVSVNVVDNGSGMDATTLRQALRFGGSTRFNDRSGIGRYGMGLPNASLSQARRLDVFTWRRGQKPLHTYLDVDEIAAGKLRLVPVPQRSGWPASVNGWSKGSGTFIKWSNCDRLDHKRTSTLVRKLAPFLGRVFRYFIWDGLQIRINGEPVAAVDPLYADPRAAMLGGRVFGEPLVYEVRAGSSGDSKAGPIGAVTVTFTELPVHDWHDLPNDEKRAMGVLNGAGVSVVRAGREIDYGWFFLNGKRRENYDDWWRCEIRFDPILDEAFGLAHTKQQIRPTEQLVQLLAPDMESIARALNSRVRQAHLTLKARDQLSQVEKVARERDGLLKPLPAPKRGTDDSSAIRRLAKKHPALNAPSGSAPPGNMTYTIIEGRHSKTDLFSVLRETGRLVLVLNADHPFHKQVYRPLAESETARDKELLGNLQLLLLAAARAAAAVPAKGQQQVMANFVRHWSDTLATFLNG